MTTTTMTHETAGYIIRRKPQSVREREIVGEALAVLGAAGFSDHEATIQSQRELSLAELILLGQARVAAGMGY